MKALAYSSPFVPAEWIAAHGLRPMRLIPLRQSPPPRAGATWNRQGLCPFAQAFCEDVANACGTAFQAQAGKPVLPDDLAGAVLTTTCDQMRRAAESLQAQVGFPVFLMNVPATWQSPTAAAIYLDELARLGRFMVRLGGHAPTDADLADTTRAYERARQAVLSAGRRMTARRLVERIFEVSQCTVDGLESLVTAVSAEVAGGSPWHGRPAREYQGHLGPGRTAADGHAIHGQDAHATPDPGRTSTAVALVGGPLLGRDLDVLDLIEQCGGQVVLNASESGRRCLPAPFDRRQLSEQPLAELASAYFGAIPDIFRRPDSLLHEYLARELPACGARGVILVRQVWCDLWHAQVAPLRTQLGLPLLDLDLSCPDSAAGSIANRVQAFLEILQ
jgi:benzoyl-CoA reductase/2-hydroxyglutaryl-CoA dehydratase subunit BcrC/BadD/HgdB